MHLYVTSDLQIIGTVSKALIKLVFINIYTTIVIQGCPPVKFSLHLGCSEHILVVSDKWISLIS